MVTVTTSVERSFLRNGTEVFELRVPAVNESQAQRKARFNARAKGAESPEVAEVEEIGKSGVPGVKLFLVTVEAAR